MPLTLYNTAAREKQTLDDRLVEPGKVRIYVCGLTPSAEGHLGHARSFMFFDVLRRYLEHPRNGYRVTYVQNVTDIDDRAIATAAREGTTYDAVVRRYYGAFKASMRKLGVREPDHEPYATGYIAEILAMIGELIDRGHAYVVAGDGIYYAVESFDRYGELSGKNVDELRVGARIAENERKADPLDFALWKFAKPGEPQWDSRWGGGRPGWHIECSAMSRALLGVPFDLHGGGYDLIFPHHENEIAQSEPLMPDPPMTRMWLHGGLLNFDGRKMSKSLGNFEPLSQLLERHDPLAIRLLFLQTGYRKPMNFTEDAIAGVKRQLRRLQRAAGRLLRDGDAVRDPAGAYERVRAAGGDAADAVDAIFAALDDDMDTARAVGFLIGLARDQSTAAEPGDVLAVVRDVASIVGLGPAFSDEALRVAEAEDEPDVQALTGDLVERLRARLGDAVPFNGAGSAEAAIQLVIEARAAARKNKDFALGDRLRDGLAAEGVVLKDSKEGTTWTVAAT